MHFLHRSLKIIQPTQIAPSSNQNLKWPKQVPITLLSCIIIMYFIGARLLVSFQGVNVESLTYDTPTFHALILQCFGYQGSK